MDFDSHTLWIIKATLGVVTFVSLVIAYLLRKYLSKIRYADFLPYIILHMFILNSQPPLYVRHPAATRYQTATILSTAFLESIGIYGLILFLMSGEFITLYAFVIVSAIALLYFRPRFEELEKLAIDMKQAQHEL
jgi:membrane protein implicated in regulation of membrane protease activity